MVKLQGRPDAILLTITTILVIFGVVMVFSASYYSTISANEGPYSYLVQSVRWALFGFAVMIAAAFVPVRVYYVLAPLIVLLSVAFLIALFFVGTEINGATRWIPFGPLTFMPGEFAKVAVIIGCAWFYSKYASRARTFVHGFLPVIIMALVFFYLINKQPNLSTAIIVIITIVAMMFIAGVNIFYIAGAIFCGVMGILYMIQRSQGYQLSRITGFTDPFSDAQGDFFQTVQGLLALGSGGLTGVGLGNSVEKALWLPFAQNDFIFAIIGEETGFIGCLLLLIGFVLLIWRCMLIAIRSGDRFPMLLGSGIAMLFAIQVIVNIGVVTAVLPPTGVILPFISYGGNAIVLFMFMVGISLSISRGDGVKVVKEKRKRRIRIEEVAA